MRNSTRWPALLAVALLVAGGLARYEAADEKPRADEVLALSKEAVYSIAYSRDGKMLASGHWGGEIDVWDASPAGLTKSKNSPLKGHTAGVMSLAFSPDGKTLASGSWDKTVKLWDLASGEAHTLEGHDGPVSSVAFSPDGKTLASGSWDKTVKLWDVERRAVKTSLTDHTEQVLCVAFSRDGKTLASGGEDLTIRLWKGDTGAGIKSLPVKTSVRALAFGADGKVLASNGFATNGSRNGILLWDITQSEPRATLNGHDDIVTSLAFSLNGKVLISGSPDGTVKIWDGLWGSRPGDGTTSQAPATLGFTTSATSLASKNAAVRSVAFSPDGKRCAAGGDIKDPKQWVLGSDTFPIATLKGHKLGVLSLAVSRDRTLLASASQDSTIKLWDVGTESEIVAAVSSQTATSKDQTSTQLHKDGVTSVAFAPDGKSLASGSYDDTLRVWQVPARPYTGSLDNPVIFQARQARVSAVAYVVSADALDGRTLASAGDDNTIKLWDTPTGRVKGAPLKGHTSYVTSLALSPDGNTLASGSWDKTIRLWDVQRPEPGPLGDGILGKHDKYVTCVAFSPVVGANLLASGGYDNKIRLWDVKQTKELEPLEKGGHTDVVRSLAFSPDGTMLVSGGDDNTVRIWDVKSRKVLRVCEHDAPVHCVTFVWPWLVASGSFDKTIKFWLVFPDS
jgi:WD40 repeat protein